LYKGQIVAARWENEDTKWPILVLNEITKVEEDWWDSEEAIATLDGNSEIYDTEDDELTETVRVGDASDGKWMSEKEWNNTAATGCDYCSVGFLRPQDVVILNNNTFVCEGCAQSLAL
jgi:hypothetical protein